MGNHPVSSLHQFPLKTYVNSNIIHQSQYFEHANRKLGMATYPINDDKYQVSNMRLQLNYLQRYVRNKNVKLLHQRLLESPPLNAAECFEYISKDPTICASYASIYIKRNTTSKICMPLHALFISSIQSPFSVVKLIYEKYPFASRIKINGLLPLDLFELNHKDHPQYIEIKDFLYAETHDGKNVQNNSRLNNDYEKVFDLVRTSPLSITSLKRMLAKNSAIAFYIDAGLTPLHHLCGFWYTDKRGMLGIVANQSSCFD